MKSGIFICVLNDLHVQRRKSYVEWKHKKYWSSKFDQDCSNISETIKYYLDFQV